MTFLGLAFVPDLGLAWVLLGAIGCGSLIVIALSLFSLRTVNPPQAASLSGMAQSVGYGFSAVGPVMFGGPPDVTGGWIIPLIAIAAGVAVLALTGWFAGRDRVIGDPSKI